MRASHGSVSRHKDAAVNQAWECKQPLPGYPVSESSQQSERLGTNRRVWVGEVFMSRQSKEVTHPNGRLGGCMILIDSKTHKYTRQACVEGDLRVDRMASLLVQQRRRL